MRTIPLASSSSIFMRNFTTQILKYNIALVCIVVLLGCLAHSSMLPAAFKTLDDSHSIINNENIKSLANTAKIFKSSFFGDKHYYRPLVSITYMLEYHFFGLQPFYYNLTNLALHLSIAVTVFFLMFLILKDRLSAFFVALLFAIHPIQWEAVANIPGRAVILSTFFTINSLFFYCLAQEKKRFAVCYGLSLLFFTGGLLSKESAGMLPVLLLSYIFLVENNVKKSKWILPYFLLILVYIVFRQSLGIAETYGWPSTRELVLGFVTFLRACLTYVRLFVWPVGLHFDRAQELFGTFYDLELWATLFVYVAVGLLGFRWRKQITAKNLFFIAWFWIELFPVSQIVTTIGVGPGYISTAEHFLYVPAIGAFALLVSGLKQVYHLNEQKRFVSANIFKLATVGFLCFLILTTVNQALYARTTMTMFQQTLKHNPNNTRILYSMGMGMVHREEFGEAEHYFRRALAQDPFHLSAHIALGRSLHDQGKFAQALAVYQTIKDVGRGNELLEANLKEVYPLAINQYKAWIAKTPDNAQLYYSLGTVYSRSGLIHQGIDEYKKAIILDPFHKKALFNLASSYESLGQTDLAVEYYEQMLALEGDQDDMDRYVQSRLAGIYQQSKSENGR